MRQGLEAYVEAEIIPRYRHFDKAHQEDHARVVIRQALELAQYYDVDTDPTIWNPARSSGATPASRNGSRPMKSS